jgi:hypothetical protein
MADRARPPARFRDPAKPVDRLDTATTPDPTIDTVTPDAIRANAGT